MFTASRSRIYQIKSVNGVESLMRILREEENGYQVLITSKSEGRNRTSEEFITRDLVESCLRTGYLTEIDEANAKAATA